MPERTVSVGLVADVSNYISGMQRASSATGGLGKQAQTTGDLTRSMVSKVGGSLSNLGNNIGGTFGTILSQVGNDIQTVSTKAAHLSTALEVGGGAAVAAGVGLQFVGAGAKQASDQLDAAITNSGDSVDKYAGKIDAAVKKGQNFDHSAEDTKAALTKLIPAAGSTQKALDQMGVVTDLAAAKHISLSDAATQVAKILSGTGARTLSQYGITMEKVADPTKALAAANNKVESATNTLAAAQKRLTDLQEIDHGKKKLTISDHLTLANAQDAVTKASGKLAGAQAALAETSKTVITKTQAGSDALDQLSKKLNGQASSSVKNFGSQFDIAKTKVEDFVKEAAGPVGGVLAGVGAAAQIAGVGLDIYKAKQAAATAADIARTAAAEAAATATDAETASQVALDGAMDANPIGLVAAALGGLAAIIGGGILLDGTLDNTKATADFTGALDDNTNATLKNVRAIATKALLDDGALKAGEKAGIQANVLVDASLGVAGAQAQVNAQLATYKQVQEDAFNSQADKNGQDILGIKYSTDYAKTIDTVTEAVGSVGKQYRDQLAGQQLYNAGMASTGLNAAIASGQVGALATQLHSLGASSPGAVAITVAPKGPNKKVATGGYLDNNGVSHFATGGGYGVFRGPGSGTSDSIPAMVSNGEYINKASTVARLGVDFFQRLNQGGSPAPVYQSAPSIASHTTIVNVPVTVSGSLIGNEDYMAKTITTSVQKGLKSGVVTSNWNSN